MEQKVKKKIEKVIINKKLRERKKELGRMKKIVKNNGKNRKERREWKNLNKMIFIKI